MAGLSLKQGLRALLRFHHALGGQDGIARAEVAKGDGSSSEGGAILLRWPVVFVGIIDEWLEQLARREEVMNANSACKMREMPTFT